MNTLPTTTKERKEIPLARGVLDYFPAALAAVAALSKAGNDKHNPGEDIHWARGKSMDHADCILRHLIDRGTIDPEDGILHDVKVAWRALANLQEELEKRGAPMARGARLPKEMTEAREWRAVDEHSVEDEDVYVFEPYTGCWCRRCQRGREVLEKAKTTGGPVRVCCPPGYGADKMREIL